MNLTEDGLKISERKAAQVDKELADKLAEERYIDDPTVTLDHYQKKALSTASYPRDAIAALSYVCLGLCGESGEIAEKIKKAIHKSNGENSTFDKILSEQKEALQKELGDVLWYLSALATELDISLSDVANTNLKKLYSRQLRKQIIGSGDER